MNAFFVTGTGTGVGKTTVTCALLATARARGLTAAGHKPVESGCPTDEHGNLLPLDAIALAHAAGESPASSATDHASPPDSNVYRLRAPLAPAHAAQLEHQTLSFEPILRAFHDLRARAPHLLLVEGAGGLLVPLTSTLLIADLAVALDLPLLIVADDQLGTINHTLLTVEVARRRGLSVAGVILCQSKPAVSQHHQIDADRNAATIARFGDVSVLGRLPHQPDLSPAALAAAAARHLDLSTILPPPPGAATPGTL